MPQTKPLTNFRIQAILHGDIAPETIALLRYMCSKGPTRPALSVETPDHPFFKLPGWENVFQRGSARVVSTPRHTFNLIVKGTTVLEEQDIALFLRWLLPNIMSTGNELKRIAEVRSAARNNRETLTYFVRNEELSVEFLPMS